jgi:ABC-type Na+ efflux pump permease subunit
LIKDKEIKEEKTTGQKILAKLLSVKTWVVLWAMFIITFCIVADRSEFLLIAQMLCVVPPAYLGVNVWQKNILSKEQ